MAQLVSTLTLVFPEKCVVYIADQVKGSVYTIKDWHARLHKQF